MPAPKISIVYDNELSKKNLQTGWGFSCVIEHSGRKILFDTGDNPAKLLFNLNKLHIATHDFDAIVLSHNHWDHIGGLDSVIEKSEHTPLYFGKSYPAAFQKEMSFRCMRTELVSDICSIGEGIFTGPEMGEPGLREIPLSVQTDKGLVLITGCAHPGILNIAQTIRKRFSQDIYMVLGGFHLNIPSKIDPVIEGLRQLGIKKFAPCHCTGERAIKQFRDEFGDDYIQVGAGLIINI